MGRQQLARGAALGALGIAVVAILIVLFTGGPSYRITAQFYDAGQLVSGDIVTVAGHQVGSVGSIKLSNNGLAEIELDISDQSIVPIHSSTIATIGQLSLTGVANRFVGLSLSGGGQALPSGGILPVTQTRGIVDLDTVLDSLTPQVRSQLQQIIRTGAYFFRQPTASQIGPLIDYLNPAFSQTTQLGAEIVSDRFALEQLISTSAQIAHALAARDSDLGGAVSNTATALREIASERSALGDAIARSPAVLHQATPVLNDLDYALTQLDPVFKDLQPVAPRVANLLRALLPAAGEAVPTIAGVEALVAPAKAALTALPPAVNKAVPAVSSLATALKEITPILAGLRPYAPDAVAGFFNGVGGATGGAYDANGHYLKSALLAQGTGVSMTGLLSLVSALLGHTVPGAPLLTGGRTGLLAPCPGGGSPPSWDSSAPWTQPDIPAATGNLCNPANDQQP